MEPIKQKLLNIAIDQLKALKAEFKIFCEGEEFGTLNCQVIKPNRIKEKIIRGNPGDLLSFHAGMMDLTRFYWNVYALARVVRGPINETFVMSRRSDDKIVDLLIVK